MQEILYMGDTSLPTAASYLAGVMAHNVWPFRYIPSDRSLTAADVEAPAGLYILSDYPAARATPELQRLLLRHVAAGAGLLMIGGWESFHGLGGNWDETPIGDALPVEIGHGDDRLNCDHPVVLRRRHEHPLAAGLPWDQRPPVVGGLNRVAVRKGAQLIVEAQHFSARWTGELLQLEPGDSDPAVVVGRYDQGRTAVLTTDAAPHWVGPLVDWGPQRITAQAPGAGEVEVGSLYVQFLTQLLAWTAGEN